MKIENEFVKWSVAILLNFIIACIALPYLFSAKATELVAAGVVVTIVTIFVDIKWIRSQIMRYISLANQTKKEEKNNEN